MSKSHYVARKSWKYAYITICIVWAVVSLLGITSCSPTDPTDVEEVQPIRGDAGDPKVSSTSTLPFVYGADGVGAYIFPISPSGVICAKFDVSHGRGTYVHFVGFEMPQQEKVVYEIKAYVPEDVTHTICLKVPKVCFNYQWDTGVGRVIPPHGEYTNEFITSREDGIPCGSRLPESTPIPQATPTIPTIPLPTVTPTPPEECEQPCGGTPTQTPTMTPTMTPTVQPTSTPTPSCVLPVGTPLICHSAYGSPEAECGAFGLIPLGKDDDLEGATHPSSMNAPFAIVKNGRGTCPAGQQGYRTYQSVTLGQILEKPLGGGDISHVTYCGCGT